MMAIVKTGMRKPPRHEAGISLIELMIAITIGLVISGILAFVFVDSSRSFRELRKSGEQIENGRYALAVLADDIRHAGFFGQLSTFAALTVVNPCAVPTMAHLSVPIQVISADNLTSSAASPGACLPATEIAVGSDILVIRRADTNLLVDDPIASATNPTGTPIPNALYLQANVLQGEIQVGGSKAVGLTKKADGDTAATILRRDGNGAPIRRLHVSIYYVSPCSQQICGSGGGDGIRTLKRMDRITNGTAASDWTIFPLVSGIEFMQVDIGLDTLPTKVNVASNMLGDGVADGVFVQTTADWNNVVALRVNLLARSLEPTPGHVDTKTYSLGLAGSVAGGNSLKRKVFAKEIRLNNPSGRRERVPGLPGEEY